MSKKVRFQSLVQLHEAQETEARRVVGTLERQRAEVEARLQSLAEERHQASMATGVKEREQLSRYWVHIDASMKAVHAIRTQLDTDIDKAKRVLAEAHRIHGVFLKLQEQDVREQQKQRERQAQRRLEEFATLNFIKQQEGVR